MNELNLNSQADANDAHSNQFSLTTDDFEFLEKCSNTSSLLAKNTEDSIKQNKKSKSKNKSGVDLLNSIEEPESKIKSKKSSSEAKSKTSKKEAIVDSSIKKSKKTTKSKKAVNTTNTQSYYDEDDDDEHGNDRNQVHIKKDLDYEEL